MNKKYVGPFFQTMAVQLFIFSLAFISLAAQENEKGYKLRTVVIDAGHGGKDPGSPGKLTTESVVVLAIALKLGNYIENQLPDVKVIYTRKTDDFIPLHQRAEIANANKADLFISIHANGNPNTMVTGTESLVLGLHRAGENFEVAKKENAVILLEDDYHTRYEGFDPNSPESYIIFSLMQNLYFEQSINMAALVQDQLRERTLRKDRGVKQQGLLVLARTSMPGILIETGFITNPEEEKYLMSDEGQDYIASAIFRAFRDYRKIIESRSSFAMASRTNKTTEIDEPAVAGDSNTADSFPVEKKPLAIQKSLPRVEFKVQITASSRPISPGSHVFKGLTGVSEYHIGDIYKYAVGSSPTFQDIIPYSKQIKERFPDAFIIAVKESGIIPLDQALQETQQKTSNN
jgi:N-acetylmuramoyl-L-alanine amidase